MSQHGADSGHFKDLRVPQKVPYPVSELRHIHLQIVKDDKCDANHPHCTSPSTPPLVPSSPGHALVGKRSILQSETDRGNSPVARLTWYRETPIPVHGPCNGYRWPLKVLPHSGSYQTVPRQ